jgi:hypothetical protein
MAPFEALYGYCPDFTVPPGPPTKFLALDSCLRELRETCKEAEAVLRVEKRTMKETFEAGKATPHVFTPRQKVWLSSRDISLSAPSHKLAPRQLGPYEVLDRTGDLTYRLALPPTMRQHPVFHVDCLAPWQGNDIQGREPPPPEPIEIDEALEYEVEQILDSCKYRNQLQYLVKWQGYDRGHNSWEPATNLTHCAELLDTFHAEHPAAPCRVAASLFATFPWQPRLVFTDPEPCQGWELGIGDHWDVGLEEGVM